MTWVSPIKTVIYASMIVVLLYANICAMLDEWNDKNTYLTSKFEAVRKVGNNDTSTTWNIWLRDVSRECGIILQKMFNKFIGNFACETKHWCVSYIIMSAPLERARYCNKIMLEIHDPPLNLFTMHCSTYFLIWCKIPKARQKWSVDKL